jgi:hypothetical protein
MKSIRVIVASLLAAVLIGCPSQSTTAALVAILGNAVASVAALQGNSELASKLQTDTQAAVTAVQNWKQGTPAQDAIQALNLVESDLNLFPQLGPYAPLIDLAIGTTESIIALLPSNVATPAVAHRSVSLQAPAPKSAAEFKANWNTIVSTTPSISKSVMIK